ncbi:DUF4159 domain-containing protein [Haliangium sp.]|uniref:DUF4159 domain-containing protein n=1 Tax=Haliangium sp. TaxID=2663208 RepID=UPI003D12ED90
MTLSRRRLLGLAAAAWAGLATRPARAIGPGSAFRFGQLVLGESWNPRPTALRRMGLAIRNRTSIDVELEARPVSLGGDDLHLSPFLYLAGEREFAIPRERELEALRRYLTFGGFLVIDSAEGTTDGAFDRSVRRLMQALFPPPAPGFEIVPGDHVVYKSFYLLERPLGRLAISPAMEGVMRDGRMMVAYIQNDLGGAFARDDFGIHRFQCVPGGEAQRELATRMIINLVMYALCLDYKEDQVHVPFIMRRRRWRPDDGATPVDE